LQVVNIIRCNQEVNIMPELRCPECGNELLPHKPDDLADYCVCTSCVAKRYIPGKKPRLK
jgi:formylmethanofuran dehydrogenase subunit E